MAIAEQSITDRYAVYSGDCMEVIPKLPDGKIGLSVYSPPFAGLYNYSSSERDFSNSPDYPQFLAHYRFLVEELARVTMPGRVTAVHCMDIPTGNTGNDHLRDFSGDVIRLHEAAGWHFMARFCIWKDPFEVYIRTLAKNLRHRTVTEDSTKCTCAGSDYLLVFRKRGENPEPVTHSEGLLWYAGGREVPAELEKFRGWKGKQVENRFSQWVWRNYASAFWDDIRLDRVLPFRDCKEPDDEKHVHPLQLDVIDRAVTMWSNPGDTVLTPFMGVGSEVYGAVSLGRKAIGIELKQSYYRQALANLQSIGESKKIVPEKKSITRDMWTDEKDADADGAA